MNRQYLMDLWKAFRANKPVFWSVVLVTAWRACLELLNQFIYRIKPLTPGVSPLSSLHNLLRWTRWDGGWYLSIIDAGYNYAPKPGQPENFAFFPAFPISVRAISHFTNINPVIVGLTLNFLATILLAILLYKLALLMVERYVPSMDEKKHQIACLALLLYLLYPSSPFLIAFYADALLVLGTTGCIYYALRERYFIAGLFGALATASKSLSLLLIPVLLLIILENSKEPWKKTLVSWKYIKQASISCITTALGLGLYMAYLWTKFGDPLLFYKAEKYWGRSAALSFPKTLYHDYYRHILHPGYFGTDVTYMLMVLIMVLPFITMGLALWFSLKSGTYWLLAMTFLTLLIPLSTGVMDSLNRYALSLTPLAVVAAILFIQKFKHYAVIALYLLISSAVLLRFTAGFLNGRFFAG